MGYNGGGGGPGGPDSIMGTGSDRVQAIGGQVLTADTALVTYQGRLLGWSIQESSGTAACQVILYDNTVAQGQIIDFLAAGSAASNANDFFDQGIDVQSGIFVHLASGQARVVLRFRSDIGTD